MSDSKSVEQEYHALVSGQGFVGLDNWTTMHVAGKDRASFLHNLCTNDINGLGKGECCEAFCTDVKGKIVAHVLVTSWDDRLVLLTVPGQAETLIAHLDRYIICEDVQLADESSNSVWFAALVGDARSAWSDGNVIPHVR